ncbi:MAG: hypothetical protein A2504_14650 [Bdellovibrionales bacterium RIFOXYD12_FULL_39_22]|nr:MAG: hypothetical protein A2385_15130 [Bdellovibrionales bacterium RIFOXYB1_FULL_39_21]OFZ40534.1 MAG: hypothetical protein A2485_13540 [Bdellovibrionales bacterium RIFOXYC12_FULL_39_17]OFZ49550.1 MAG: hypothetical protein A2404_07865 [Bdellovibrionales bacterium RIFOXYC1_FULL_39_130]OFZ77154.1 MAG: hypothetical protein A2560_17895 [Bdellovibrionales bacterium RIFOXYD1_FULL_39_84]OFZ91430.1 MAG: hypothetical protein A2504_14650 [Bdellovibrionales bacterium RIFOXYD12_FULL_39_22]HLE09754.1 hy
MEIEAISLEELTAVTLELNSRITSDISFEIKSERNRLEEWFEDLLPPNSSGLLYRVEKGANTFCVKGIPSRNLRQDYNAIMDGDSELCARLKIAIAGDFDDLFFFPVEDYYYAEQIKKEFFNRRFPIAEDLLCNLSDPGISWWLDYSERHLAIYFNSHGVDRQEKLIRLGPIGDVGKLHRLFNKNIDLLCRLFDASEFVCTEKYLSITVRRGDDCFFNPLLSIFFKGEYSLSEDIFRLGEYSPSLHSYFYELATGRKFWLELISIVS